MLCSYVKADIQLCYCLPAGVKTLLGGEQLTAVTLALDTIMEGWAPPENDPFMTFDPKVPEFTALSWVSTSRASVVELPDEDIMAQGEAGEFVCHILI